MRSEGYEAPVQSRILLTIDAVLWQTVPRKQRNRSRDEQPSFSLIFGRCHFVHFLALDGRIAVNFAVKCDGRPNRRLNALRRADRTEVTDLILFEMEG
jgi:hypothetical protein